MFFGCEDLVYVLKNVYCVVLVGEIIGGGVYVGSLQWLDVYFMMFVFFGCLISLVMYIDWEGVGVVFDVLIFVVKVLDIVQLLVLCVIVVCEQDLDWKCWVQYWVDDLEQLVCCGVLFRCMLEVICISGIWCGLFFGVSFCVMMGVLGSGYVYDDEMVWLFGGWCSVVVCGCVGYGVCDE